MPTEWDFLQGSEPANMKSTIFWHKERCFSKMILCCYGL